jgi:hypothetical protein
MNVGYLSAGSVSGASWVYRYDDPDDLLSLAHWLHLSLSPNASAGQNPTGDEPYIYPQPLEGTFQRPSVTMTVVASLPALNVPLAAMGPSYAREHQLVLTAFGQDRAQTLRIASNLHRCFEEGGFDGVPWSVPLWIGGAGTKLARRMRVVRASLSMGMDQTDDQGKWARPLEVRVQSPRLRLERPVPIIERVVTSRSA